MTDQETYEQRKTELVGALIVFLQAGEKIGKSQAELSGEFMVAFTQAVQQAQEVQAA